MNIHSIEELYNVKKPYVQVFKKKIMLKIIGNDALMSDKREHGYITDRDMELLHFLYDVKIATVDQIIAKFPDMTAENIYHAASRLINVRCMNSFILSNQRDAEYDPSALQIYMIDFAAIPLLAHEVDDTDIFNWNARSYTMPLDLIKRLLRINDFRIAMENRLAEPPISFDQNRMFLFGRMRIIAQGQALFKATTIDGKPYTKPYIILSCITDDFIAGDHTRFNERMCRFEDWYQKKSWSINFNVPPTFIFLSDCEETTDDLKRWIEEIARGEIEQINYLEERSKDNSKAEKPFAPFYKAIRITDPSIYNNGFEKCVIRYDQENHRWLCVRTPFFAEKQLNA